jgi:hypothetical protein
MPPQLNERQQLRDEKNLEEIGTSADSRSQELGEYVKVNISRTGFFCVSLSFFLARLTAKGGF